MTWSETTKVLIFSSGRMVGGDDSEIVDVICEAVTLDLTRAELEELEGFTQKVLSEFTVAMEAVANAMGKGGSTLKVLK